MLSVSASLVHKFLLGQRHLGTYAKKTLEHSLFNPYAIALEENKLPRVNPKPDQRLEELSMRRLELQISLRQLDKKLDVMKNKHLKSHKILLHTSHLPNTPAGGEIIILK